MKLPILIFAFIVAATTTYAQNPRITSGNPHTETYAYFKGGDSIRFTIRERNDTVQITEFYRSGKIKKMSWKQDSSYYFNELGKIDRKIFTKKEKDYVKDSSITFHKNGAPKTMSVSINANDNDSAFDKTYN